MRYTAPSLVFMAGGRRLEAGGFQPAEVYDVLIANLDPTLKRRPPPDEVHDVLVTQEVAAIMAAGNAAPNRDAAEAALILLGAQRTALGDDALWSPARVPAAL